MTTTRSTRGKGYWARAILAPGFGGTAQQPLLVALADLLQAATIHSKRVEFPKGRPSEAFARELAVLRAARAKLKPQDLPLFLPGRSFGGRMCTFLAAQEPPDALVVLGYPIHPPGRTRPEDEAALESLRCPTLIVQGDHDELGPLRRLRAVARRNRHIELTVLRGAGHDFGRSTRDALSGAVEWLLETRRPPVLSTNR